MQCPEGKGRSSPSDLQIQRITINKTEEVPSDYDKIKGNEWILGIGGRGIRASLQFLEDFEKNPTDEMKEELYKFNPSLIKHFSEAIPLDIQKDIVINHKALIPYIKNPSIDICSIMIEDDLYRLLPNEDKDLVEALIEKTFYMNPDFEEDLPWTEKPMERRKEKEFFEEYGDR